METRIIRTRWHAFLDYMTALLLLVSPWLFDFTTDTFSKMLSLIAGTLILLMTLFTRNGGGVIRVIPMSIHLVMDIIIGILILVLPFVLTMEMPHILHLLVGLMLVCSGIFTQNYTETHDLPVSIPEKDAHIQGNK